MGFLKTRMYAEDFHISSVYMYGVLEFFMARSNFSAKYETD